MLPRALEELSLYERRALNTQQILCNRLKGEHCIQLESTNILSCPVLEVFYEEVKGKSVDCIECLCTGFDGENITGLRICADESCCDGGPCQ